MMPRIMASRVIARCHLTNVSKVSMRRSYANSTDSSQRPSRVPWIVAGLGLAAVGGYIVLVPAEKKEQAKDTVSQAKESVHNVKEQAKDKLGIKSSETHEKWKKLEESRRPKDNVDKDSEAGHQKASETNEHKIRHGIFSGKDFDNEISKHTSDPGKDFEEVKKAQGK